MNTAISPNQFSMVRAIVISALNLKLTELEKMMIMQKNCWILPTLMMNCFISRQMDLLMKVLNLYHTLALLIITKIFFRGKILCIVPFIKVIVHTRQVLAACTSTLTEQLFLKTGMSRMR